jgi:hypothetical protein
MHNFAPTTVVTGRVRRWLTDSTKISPISCTNVIVEDSYYDTDNGEDFLDTIAGSRVFTTMALKGNAGVSVNLSKLRPKGQINAEGLESQGVNNFTAMYSAINAEVRRGNGFKNGAVNICLEYDHPDWLDFIEAEPLSYAKKVTILPEGWLPKRGVKLDALLRALNEGTTFLYKQQFDAEGNRLETNVCMGLSLANRSTCTLAHVNLGKCHISAIPEAMVAAAKDLDWIWEQFSANQPAHFTPAVEDKQVGLGFVGLANLLAANNIKYSELGYSLLKLREAPSLATFELASDRLALALRSGYQQVAEFAKPKGYVRFFAIEPTATCSYGEVDLEGYTTTPEISPPTCHPVSKVSRRLTDAGYQDYQYPPNVECSGTDVGFDSYTSLCEEFQHLANDTGLAQGISYNIWDNMNFESLTRWAKSPLKTIYYKRQTSSDIMDKSGFSDLSESDGFWAEAEACNLDQPCSSCGA